MKKVVKYNGAFKSQLKHFTLQLSLAMVNSIKRWQLQQCKQKLTIAVVHKKVFVDCSSANKSYQVQQCRQKLSLASCAHKSYRSFDAILQFLYTVSITLGSTIAIKSSTCIFFPRSSNFLLHQLRLLIFCNMLFGPNIWLSLVPKNKTK